MGGQKCKRGNFDKNVIRFKNIFGKHLVTTASCLQSVVRSIFVAATAFAGQTLTSVSARPLTSQSLRLIPYSSCDPSLFTSSFFIYWGCYVLPSGESNPDLNEQTKGNYERKGRKERWKEINLVHKVKIV